MGVDSFSFNNGPYDYGKNSYKMSNEYYRILLSKLSFVDKISIKFKNLMNDYAQFEGECFGASSVMALMKTGELHPYAFESDADTVFSLSLPRNSEKVASLIYYYHLLQYTGKFSANDVKCNQYEMGKELVTALLNSSNPVIVNLHLNLDDKMGDHSVLAYSIDIETDNNNYIIYIADPNALVRSDRGIPTEQVCQPAVMLVDKASYTISGYSFQQTVNGSMGSGMPCSFISAISDLSLYNSYNLENSIQTRNNGSSDQFTHFTTTSPSFTIEADGKTAIINGDDIDGNLSVYRTYSDLSGDNSDIYSYCLEVADSYTVKYSEQSIKQTLLTFDSTSEKGGYVSSNANEIILIQAVL